MVAGAIDARRSACRAIVALLFVPTLGGAASCADGNDREPTRTVTEAITSGVVDPGDPAVARIEGGLSPCTGTLVADRVVLTAAHCVDLPPTSAFFGADSAGAGDRVSVIAQVAHPAYDPLRIENDVALILLERSPAVVPVPWIGGAPIGLWVGAQVRLVGFGVTAAGESLQTRKSMGTARISAAGDTELRCTADPSLPCFGDSGGPVLSGEQLIGVVSSGDPDCSDHARAMRVDAYADSFVAPQIAAWDAASTAGGGCVATGERTENLWGALLAIAGCIVAARLRIHRGARR